MYYGIQADNRIFIRLFLSQGKALTQEQRFQHDQRRPPLIASVDRDPCSSSHSENRNLESEPKFRGYCRFFPFLLFTRRSRVGLCYSVVEITKVSLLHVSSSAPRGRKEPMINKRTKLVTINSQNKTCKRDYQRTVRSEFDVYRTRQPNCKLSRVVG